jgi:hypothetical protein
MAEFVLGPVTTYFGESVVLLQQRHEFGEVRSVNRMGEKRTWPAVWFGAT